MDLFKIFSISGSGMAAQRSRMSVVAGNLANTETTRTPDGGPYKRRDVIFQASPMPGEFSGELAEAVESPGRLRVHHRLFLSLPIQDLKPKKVPLPFAGRGPPS